MLSLAIHENIDKEGDVLMFYSIVDVMQLQQKVHKLPRLHPNSAMNNLQFSVTYKT